MPHRILLFIAALVLLSACATMQEQDSAAQMAARQAQQSEAQGDYQRAADMYWLAAQKMPPGKDAVFRIKAAEMAFVAGSDRQAQAIINRISETGLSPTERARKRLVAARLAVKANRPEEAARLLDFPRAGLPVRLQEDIARLLGEDFSAAQSGSRDDALQLMKQHAYSRAPEEAALVWQQLEAMSTQEISQWLGEAHSSLERGWLELAYLYRTTPSRESREVALTAWQEKFRGHPAWPGTEMGVDPLATAGLIEARLVAVLLPRSGSLEKLSQVVLNGIMAANRSQQGVRPEVRVYDTGAGPAAVVAQYQQAVSDGAGLVIGPMRKESVDLLVREGLSVPVLTLNHGQDETGYNPNLFQFALLPEDEARQAAERIFQDGYITAIAFAPKGVWGERIIQAFGQRFTELGGQVLETGLYEGKENDYSETIVKALKVRRGKERHSGTRREDVQAIFVAATPRQARIFKPLLKFHFAEDLPVYATSHAWSGIPNEDRDRDLNGLYFVDLPWLLGEDPDKADLIPMPDELKGTDRYYPRLFALGVDSYRLAPQVKNFHALPDTVIRGYSGDIFMDQNNRFHRKLRWSVFRDGLPEQLHADQAKR